MNIRQIDLKVSIFFILTAALMSLALSAQAKEPVTVDTFVRAETDRTMASYVSQGGFGKWFHIRQPTPIDKQGVIRMNRDTLYSAGIFDLTNPVTITLPDSGGRFLSALIVNQDHSMLPVKYAPEKLTLTKDLVGTRYAIVLLRAFVDSNDPADIKKANALQDAVTVSQSNLGTFKVPDWDLEQLKTLRDAIIVLAATKENQSGFYGDKSKLNPIEHLMGTAFGWGGNPKEGAVYLSGKTEKNDGQTPYTMTITDPVPLGKGGFFSITIYNAAGFMEANDAGVYSFNNVTAKRNNDGSLTINAGGCADGRVNCIPIMKDWNYLVRFYKPGPKILSGEYQFPKFTVAK